MLAASLLLLALAQPADPGPWRSLPSDETVTNAWRPGAEDAGGGDLRRVVIRVETPDRGWAAGEMDVEYACAARTSTILSARAFDAAGILLQSVTAPPERRRAEPVWADDPVGAALYAELCPGAAPPPERPHHPPPVAVPVPRGG